jgi:phenylalanine-4-hydroxylase
LKDFSRCLSHYTIDELKAHNIAIGERVKLEYLSGITVEGCLKHVFRQEQRNLILSFEDCRVTDLWGKVLFDPSWGTYDMAVGSRIVSVYGGVADREKLQLYKPTATTETPQLTQDATLMALYATVDGVNRGTEALTAQSREQLLQATEAYPEEWLLMLEILSLGDENLEQPLRTALGPSLHAQPDLAALIQT